MPKVEVQHKCNLNTKDAMAKIKTFFEIIETLQNNLNLINNHEIILDYQRLKS